jgi:hypothetical protein
LAGISSPDHFFVVVVNYLPLVKNPVISPYLAPVKESEDPIEGPTFLYDNSLPLALTEAFQVAPVPIKPPSDI